MHSTNGFTLMELIVVVTIIAILGAIAFPAYNDYTMRSKIAEATSALSDGRIKMEQFFQDNKTYAGGPTPAATTYFTYTVPTATATGYLIVATGNTDPATGNVSMANWIFTIDQNNTKQTTGAPSGWGASTMPTNCWIHKKGGQC